MYREVAAEVTRSSELWHLFQKHSNTEPDSVGRARVFIEEHFTDDLCLAKIAKAVNVSAIYFSTLFKQATGPNFADYVARVRIEKAKNLLLNPNLRISDIAFGVGFQSIPVQQIFSAHRRCFTERVQELKRSNLVLG